MSNIYKFGLQSLAYLIAVAVPVCMVTTKAGPVFCFPFFILSVLLTVYLSEPLSAVCISVFSTAVGIGALLFYMGDFLRGIPLIFLVQIAWIWFVFWITGELLEIKELKIHHLQEEIEKLEITSAEYGKEKKEIEDFSSGIKERISRYTQIKSFTDDLASGLQMKEIRAQIESSFRNFFGKDSDIRVALDMFPVPNSPAKDDHVGDWIVEHRVPLLVADISGEQRNPLQKLDRKGSLISCPIERENFVVGTLTLESYTPKKWKEEDLRFLSDITNIVSLAISNAVYYEKVESLAVRDSLTGLFVRYRFDERLEEEFSRAKVVGSPLTLIIFDIDHFKQVNDRWGHPVGDNVLRSVSQVILAQTRETDFCARYGGEEIAILMPLTNIENALQIGERIRKKVEGKSVAAQKIKVTISGGAASVEPHMNHAQELVESSDQALYRAKKGGRNRLTLATAQS